MVNIQCESFDWLIHLVFLMWVEDVAPLNSFPKTKPKSVETVFCFATTGRQNNVAIQYSQIQPMKNYFVTCFCQQIE
jgi:hypothetical protein